MLRGERAVESWCEGVGAVGKEVSEGVELGVKGSVPAFVGAIAATRHDLIVMY